MKNFVWIILLFACCNESKKFKSTILVKVKLSGGLPKNGIKIGKFEPLYGSIELLNYSVTKKKDFFQFELGIEEPGFWKLSDQNNIGITSIFLQPKENITLEISLEDGIIKTRTIEGKYPGDNMLFGAIYDSVYHLDQAIGSLHKNFANRDKLSEFIDTLFEQTIGVSIKNHTDLTVSKTYHETVFKPQLEILKCYFKNQLIKKNDNAKNWNKFYADSVFSKPNYKFWCWDYLEYSFFKDYVYEVINHSKAVDLREFIENVENRFKKTSDAYFMKVAVSQSLIIFTEKYSGNYSDDNSMAFVLDSFCTTYNLDVRRYNFPNLTLAESENIEGGLLNKIFVEPLDSNVKTGLGEIINDTSKIYYVDYWASWCKPCIKGLPYTLNLNDKRIDKLKTLFLSVDANKADFLKAAKKYQLPATETFQIINDSSNLYNYKKLNPQDQIPVYQIIFFYRNSWRVMNALASGDPSVVFQISNLISKIKGS